jgi:hypothetical protein
MQKVRTREETRIETYMQETIRENPPYNSNYQLQYKVDLHLAMLDRSVWINSFRGSQRGKVEGERMEMHIMRGSCRRGFNASFFRHNAMR